MEHTADLPHVKRLERPTDGRMLAGVCAGLGRYFNLSPSFYRLGFVVLTLLGGAGILVYLAAVLVIPAEGKESIAAEALAERRDRPWPLIGIGLAGSALAVLLARATLWPASGSGWIVILLIGLAVVWASRGKTRGRMLVRAIVALFATLFVAAIVASAVAVAWFDVSFSDGVGTRTYQPATTADLKHTYAVGVGDLELNLTNLAPVTKPTTIHTSVGVGKLHIEVPQDLLVAVNARAKLGQLDILDRHHGGRDVRLSTPAGALLVIDAKVGAGRIDVERIP